MDVHTLWIGDQLPLLQQVALHSYLHFGHRVKLFTYDDVLGVPHGVEICSGRDVLPASRIVRYQTGQDRGSPSLFANIFRYKFLYETGGCWVDADTVCLASELPAGPYTFSSESRSHHDSNAGHPNLAYVHVTASSAVMRDCFREAESGHRGAVWGAIGPRLLAKQLRQHRPPGLNVLPALAFCALPYENASRAFSTPAYQLPDRCYGIHLWNQILRRQGISNTYRGAPGSFFDRVCRLLELPAGTNVRLGPPI